MSQLRALRDQRDATGFSRPLWARFAEMGFCGIAGARGVRRPRAWATSKRACVMEEIGRTLVPSPFLSTGVLTATALVRGGSDAQRKQYLPQIAAGRLVAALAVDEAARHRPDADRHDRQGRRPTASCCAAPRPSSSTATSPI